MTPRDLVWSQYGVIEHKIFNSVASVHGLSIKWSKLAKKSGDSQSQMNSSLFKFNLLENT